MMKGFLFKQLTGFRAASRTSRRPWARLVIGPSVLIVAAVGMVGMVGFARAGDELPGQDQALARALDNHPDIIAAKAKVALAEAELYGKRMEVSRQVIGLYGGLKSMDAKIGAAKASLTESMADSDRAQKPRADGTFNEAMKEKMAAAVQAAERNLVYATGQREQAEKELRLLIGAMPGTKETKAPNAAAPVTRQAPQGPIVETWKAKAEQPIKLSFNDAPLVEVLSFLSDKTGIKFSIQRQALEEAGEAADQPITLSTNEVSLSAALQAFQDTYPNLRFVLRDYGILLTTTNSASDHGYTPVVPDSEANSGGGTGFF